MWRFLSVAMVLGLALAQPSQAENTVDAASAASPVEAEKLAEALEQATRARDEAWQAAPIGFTTATFTDDKATGYGQYTPRPNSVFKAGEEITLYAEPVGYGYGRDGDDYLVDLDADIELHTPEGQILVREESFTRLSARSRRQIREFHVTFKLALSGLAAGDYVLVTRLKDAHSDKSGAFELPFSVPQPEPEQN